MRQSWRLSLSDAQRLVAGARAEAERIGVPMCIAVLDDGGNLVAFERMDGAKFTSIAIALDKAFTSAGTRRATREYAELAAPGGPAFGIQHTNGGRIVGFAGGLPLKDPGGEVIGGIGCSSGTPDQDEQCALAGIALWQAGDQGGRNGGRRPG